MKRLLTAVVVLIVLFLVGAVAFLYSGIYDISATSPHTAPVAWAVDVLEHASVGAAAEGISPPLLSDSGMVETGFHEYEEMCVTCHAAPGVQSSEIGTGLYPPPPELAEEVEEWSDAELFWIVKNGIKMSGMPAYGPTHDDETIWSVVAFLRELPGMTAEEYAARREAAGLAGDGDEEGGHTHDGADHTHDGDEEPAESEGEEHTHDEGEGHSHDEDGEPSRE